MTILSHFLWGNTRNITENWGAKSKRIFLRSTVTRETCTGCVLGQRQVECFTRASAPEAEKMSIYMKDGGRVLEIRGWQRSVGSVRDCLDCKIEFDGERYQHYPLASLSMCRFHWMHVPFKYSGDPLYVLSILLHRSLQSWSFFIFIRVPVHTEWDIVILL